MDCFDFRQIITTNRVDQMTREIRDLQFQHWVICPHCQEFASKIASTEPPISDERRKTIKDLAVADELEGRSQPR